MVMSDAFTVAIDRLFAQLAVDAVYTSQGGTPTAVRVIARRPDQIVGFGETRLLAETTMFDVRTSEVANPRPGDTIEIDGQTLVVQGEPVRDPERLIWTVDLRPA